MQIGVDFGGTKIEAAALGPDGGILVRLRHPNPGDYDTALETVAGLIARIEAEVGAAGSVGVGIPGSPSPRTGLIRNANSTFLNGRPFGADLAARLGREVRLANDANCLALSEAADGAGAGARVVLAVILGTGCGAGLVVDGRLLDGAHGVAAELGHIPLPWPVPDEVPGPACWCGLSGCLETWVSGRGLQRDHAALTGQALAAPDIVAAAGAGQSDAVASLSRYIDRLGRGLAMAVNLVDPDVIVLGGGMSNVAGLYPALPPVIARHVFADAWEAPVVPARWGDSSGVRGAAWLWPR
ncbi:MAG: ROK family protein [Brevundimonas sp.]|jgi:fructokinase|uniref:ROK family protein n=2 Tax=Brevundimonas sp. TaxID=1871086 RepID=UPI0022BE7013|nr:ROK family protein [Brevundimonas sp.]MCZ8087993.1 ROK family protein [Brevundimonas sp.]MCZ8194759.1 ROK family protein [Brevundimonas sp.]